MQLSKLKPDFLRYLAEHPATNGETLPTLADIGAEMGVSVGKLREQLEFARHLGLISIRPRVGMKREPFDFMPAVLPSLLYSMATGEASFMQFSQLRQTLEAAMWPEAVVKLTPADKTQLRAIIDNAWSKLRGEPVHVPNREHRDLHMTIFTHLENPFVRGILNAYWEAYEASELTRLADYGYWLRVWDYHERIVDALCRDDFDEGLELLVAHFKLLPTLSLPPVVTTPHSPTQETP
ncbi:MAG: FadR family transcriptional regulator [Anaerolineales bacterium]|nr:FadR family transcriptional regulator [Anaerolineales bacterium]MCB8950531.1 FadR family transcriptional regulator [Ardenticatenales bacterium]